MHRAQKSTPQSAMAGELFNHFCSAGSMRQILALHRSICEQLTLKPTRLPDFYPKLKDKLSTWKAQALFKKFDARANHKVYSRGAACPNTRVLIIGAGPCGLRAAIECQLLGAKVVVIEKRDRVSRNNVLHLWPFVIHDLRALGAKKFYGKFCAGAIDHISIRQLQCILLKVALLLGVEFHEGVSFEELLEPTVADNAEILGWRARVSPAEHPVSQYEFDALLGADGKRATLRGFKRKDFRGKLAIAITANFINRHSEQEASVEEISGVAFIFKQKFFKDLFRETGIDLENIVYYKDETHYFVMTAKKHSLLEKGVLKQDNPETTKLLCKENVDREALKSYAREAAHYSTDGRLPHMEFALNHYGEPDVTLFDFTSMYAAENASMVVERSGRRLLCCLVGDSLLEPFWPTGSGCARGFLSALDASWAVRAWGQTPPPHPLQVILERESIYRLLAQTTPENLQRDFGAYTLDPRTRYPNLNKTAVTAHRVAAFYNSDDPLPLDATATMRKRKRETQVGEEALVGWLRRAIGATGDTAEGVGADATSLRWAVSPPALAALLRCYRPDLLPPAAPALAVYSVLLHEFYIQPMGSPRSAARGEVSDGRMRAYLRAVYRAFKGEVPHVQHNTDIAPEIDRSENGNRHEERRPDSSRRYRKRKSRNSQEEGKAVGVGARSGSGATVARLAAELARGGKRPTPPRAGKPGDLLRSVGRIEPSDWNVRSIERKMEENRMGRPAPRQAERVPKWDREKFLARQNRLTGAGAAPEEPPGELEQAVKHIDMLRRDAGRPALGTKKVARLAEGFDKKTSHDAVPLVSPGKPWTAAAAELVATAAAPCAVCSARVFAAESVVADGLNVHRRCFRCAACRMALRPGSFLVMGNRLTCLHHSQSALAEGAARPESGTAGERASAEMSERITLEASDAAAAEMDEEEWAGRNFLTSETSGAGGLSDDSSSDDEYTEAASESLCSDPEEEAAEAEAEGAEVAPEEAIDGLADDDAIYLTDSYEDDFSDDSASSAGGESSRLVAAREARRREVPAPRDPPPTDSSEVESEEESESETDTSSATEVSTDSEFDEEEAAPPKAPPAITVTAPPMAAVRPAPQPPPRPLVDEYPLSRTRSAGGIATKRALELKRRYLLGESSPTAVRRSDSASRLDSKIENFRMNISQFQKLLNPAPNPPNSDRPHRPFELFLLETTTETSDRTPTIEKKEEILLQEPSHATILEATAQEIQLDTDSLSEDSSSSVTKTGPSPPVPRVEVHNASGELVQFDSLMIVNAPSENEKDEQSKEPMELSKPESESSESCKDATTLALTETELSDWAADGGVLDEMGLEEKLEWDRHRTSERNPRVLSAPKNIHETKNISTISAHVCGREEEDLVIFSNATEHFEFADEGEDVSIEVLPPRNAGYMEFVDEDYRENEDRSIDFIEHTSSCIECPSLDPYPESGLLDQKCATPLPPDDAVKNWLDETVSPVVAEGETPTITERSSTLYNNGHLSLSKSSFTNLTEMSSSPAGSEDTSPPATGSVSFSAPLTFVVRASVPYRHMSHDSPPPTPPTLPSPTSKADQLKREREQQTEVVRRLVMGRIGGGAPVPARKCSRRARPVPAACPAPPPPARPPPPLRLVPSMSDPELARVRRRRGIIQTVSDFFNRRVGTRKKWRSEPAEFHRDGRWEEWRPNYGVSAPRPAAPAAPPPLARRASHGAAPTTHPSYCCPSLYRTTLEGGAPPPPLPPVQIWTSE